MEGVISSRGFPPTLTEEGKLHCREAHLSAFLFSINRNVKALLCRDNRPFLYFGQPDRIYILNRSPK